MWRQLLFILLLTLATAIKVPVDNTEESTTVPVTFSDQSPTEPENYASENSGVDSYLIPPDPHKLEEGFPDDGASPATFLIPPAPDKQTDYYTPSSPEQSDWYPIAQTANKAVKLQAQRQTLGAIPIFMADENNPEAFAPENPRGGKAKNQLIIPIPSLNLEPPAENAPNDYLVPPPSEELELPAKAINQQFNPQPIKPTVQFNPVLTNTVPLNFRFKPAEPLALHLLPPKLQIANYKTPTKLYPKKFAGGFKPVPIPIAQFAEDSSLEVPQAKPVKYFKPISGVESELISPDDKKVYLYEQAELKRKLKGEEAAKEQLASDEGTYTVASPTEQEASESNFRYPGNRNVYSAPLKQASAAPPPQQQETYPAPPPGERTEFRMHGMKGPHSYQFGYDTGKG